MWSEGPSSRDRSCPRPRTSPGPTELPLIAHDLGDLLLGTDHYLGLSEPAGDQDRGRTDVLLAGDLLDGFIQVFSLE